MQAIPQSEAIQEAVAKASELLEWINDKLNGIEVNGDHRHRIPAQLFDLSIDHALGIVRLIAATGYASAFALLRCQFECFVRGAWLHHCATDDEINDFVKKDKIQPKVGELIEAIEQTPPYQKKLLSAVKDQAWKPMNGYTHGGIHQISRRLQGDYIEPIFGDDEILEVVQFAGTIALIAFGEIAGLAKRDDLIQEAQALMDSGASTVIPTTAFPSA